MSAPSVSDREKAAMEREVDAAITAYTRLQSNAAGADSAEVRVYEERLLTCVRDTLETPADRVRGAVGYRALCALLLPTELDRLSDRLTYRIGADGPDMAAETVQATLNAYVTGGLRLEQGRASLRDYLNVAGHSHAERFRRRREREVLTDDPDQIPDAGMWHEGQPQTLDYMLGTGELGRWIQQALANLSDRDFDLVYETARGGRDGKTLAELTGIKKAQVSQNKTRAINRFLDQFSTMWVARTMCTTALSRTPETPTGSGRRCADLSALLTGWDHRAFGDDIFTKVRRHILVQKCPLCASEFKAFRSSGANKIMSEFRALPLALASATLHRWLNDQTQDESHHRRSILDIFTNRRPPARLTSTPASAPIESTASTTATVSAALPQTVLAATAVPAVGPLPSRAWTPISAVTQRILTLHPVHNAMTRIQLIAGSVGGENFQRAGAVTVAAVVAGTALVLTGGPDQGAAASSRPTITASPHQSSTPAPTTSPLSSPAGTATPTGQLAIVSSATGQSSTPATGGSQTQATPTATSTATQATTSPPASPAGPPTNATGSTPSKGTHGGTLPVLGQKTVDLTGRWQMRFERPGISLNYYSVQLSKADNAQCLASNLPLPCYQGVWWNMQAQRYESTFVVSAKDQGSQYTLTGVEPGHIYQGTAPGHATVPIFSGTAVLGTGQGNAVFTLTRNGLPPGQEQPLSAFPGAVDMTGPWVLDFRPLASPENFYAINLKRQPDDYCIAFTAHLPCFAGGWLQLSGKPDGGTGFFTLVTKNGRLYLDGTELTGYGQPGTRYSANAPDTPSNRQSLSGSHTVGGKPYATFTLRRPTG